MKVKTTRFYVPIQRTEREGDTLIVEGYAFVNPKVKSDKYNLTRAAMEAASAGYFEFPAIREMHQPAAAGVGLSHEWDERGVKLVAKIVDDAAIKKVEEGVYRGFSVGIRPTVVRGSDVVSCDWIETSLVDRPADPDALIISTRGEALPDEVEADEQPEDEVLRAEFTEAMNAREKRVLTSAAIDTFADVLYSTLLWEDTNDAATRVAALKKAASQFVAYVAPLCERGERFIELGGELVPRADFDTEIARFKTTISTLESERDASKAELERVRTEKVNALKRVAELEATPTAPKAVRVPDSFQRKFAAELGENAEVAAAKRRLSDIESMTQSDLQALPETKRQALAAEIGRLKNLINS